MKKLTLIFTLLFSILMFSSTSFAEWTKVGKHKKSYYTFYVDFERVRNIDGYVYFWELRNFIKPIGNYSSLSFYQQGDCKLFRIKILSGSFHTKPMGDGTADTDNQKYGEWNYPHPDSTEEAILKAVCSR